MNNFPELTEHLFDGYLKIFVGNLYTSVSVGWFLDILFLWALFLCFFMCIVLSFAVQSWGCVWLFVTQWTEACQASLSCTVFWSLLKLTSIELVILSNHLIFCFPLLLWPSIFPSITVFFHELALCIRWPKHWSFSIGPSNEYSELISIRIDWLHLLAFQGTLKSLL